jgi:hypothetical protein
VGLARPSLGALTLIGGFLELARVGIGKGGSCGSGKLGLLARWWVAIPFWIIAALRIPFDLLDVPLTDERAMAFELDLANPEIAESLVSLPSGMLNEL